MPLAETTRGTLWFDDARHDPARPVMLMIHGAGGAHFHWPPEVRQMPEANAIAPDLRGHGQSPGEGHHTIGEYAADLIALLDALHIDKVIAAGHSMGGAIALTLALVYPRRVSGLVLVGTGAKLAVHPDILRGVVTEFLQTARTLIEWQWSDHADKDVREILGYKTLIGTPAPIVSGDYAACNAFDVRANLADIQVPTLIFAGTHDKMTPLKYGQYLHERIAGSKLVVVENGAHMLALEQPQVVAQALRTWLTETYDAES